MVANPFNKICNKKALTFVFDRFLERLHLAWTVSENIDATAVLEVNFGQVLQIIKDSVSDCGQRVRRKVDIRQVFRFAEQIVVEFFDFVVPKRQASQFGEVSEIGFRDGRQTAVFPPETLQFWEVTLDATGNFFQQAVTVQRENVDIGAVESRQMKARNACHMRGIFSIDDFDVETSVLGANTHPIVDSEGALDVHCIARGNRCKKAHQKCFRITGPANTSINN